MNNYMCISIYIHTYTITYMHESKCVCVVFLPALGGRRRGEGRMEKGEP